MIERSKPLLESADNLAVATFDRAQATFPCEWTASASTPASKRVLPTTPVPMMGLCGVGS